MKTRLRTLGRLGLATVLACGANVAFAQAPQPGFGPPQTFDGRPDAGFQSAGGPILQTSTIVGANVLLQGGGNFGQVQDIVLNNSGCVDFVVVSNGGRYYPVPWGVTMWQNNNRALLVGFNRGQIGRLPSYTQISQLSNAKFSQQVHSYYRGNPGMRPRDNASGQQDRNKGNDRDKSATHGKSDKPKDRQPPAATNGKAGSQNGSGQGQKAPAGNRENQNRSKNGAPSRNGG